MVPSTQGPGHWVMQRWDLSGDDRPWGKFPGECACTGLRKDTSESEVISTSKEGISGRTENQLGIRFYLGKSHSSFLSFFPPLTSFFLRQCKFLEVDLASGKQAALGLESTFPLPSPQPQKQEDLTMWNSPLVSIASGGMLFLPSYFFPHTSPALLGNLFLFLLLFNPPQPF